jgi:uncharacterized protein
VATDNCPKAYLTLLGRVTDHAGLLIAEEEERLTGVLADLEGRTKHQLVVATIPSLGGDTIERFGLCHANHWGVGRKEEDDGVVLFVAPNDRKVRIEVGLGLEDELSDEEAKAIVDVAILPSFKEGKFATGINAGVSAIIAEIGPAQ